MQFVEDVEEVRLTEEILILVLQFAIRSSCSTAWMESAELLMKCSIVCKSWMRTANNELLWKEILNLQMHIKRSRPNTFDYKRRYRKVHSGMYKYVGNYQLECFRRMKWRQRLVKLLKDDICWPTIREIVFEQIEEKEDISFIMLIDILRESESDFRCTADQDEVGSEESQGESEAIPHLLGMNFWCKEVLWRLAARKAIPRLKYSLKTEEEKFLNVDVSRRLCEENAEIYIEEGALAIASLFNVFLDDLNIPERLEILSVELSRRLGMFVKHKYGFQTNKSHPRTVLSVTEQIKVINSLVYNRPHPGSKLTSVEDIQDWVPKAGELGATSISEWPGLGLSGNISNYDNPMNCLLDSVLGLRQKFKGDRLKQFAKLDPLSTSEDVDCMGMPISLAILYAAIGRRAGIPVKLVSAPRKVFVSIGTQYVDVFVNGKILTRDQWMAQYSQQDLQDDSNFTIPTVSASPKEINLRLCMNLIHMLTEQRNLKPLLALNKLALVIDPNNHDLLLRYAQVNAIFDKYDDALHSIEKAKRIVQVSFFNDRFHSWLTDSCERFQQRFKIAQFLYQKNYSTRRYRKNLVKPVKYYVGQVVQHALHGYKGVIYGWDETCEADDLWVNQMHIDKLSLGQDQPFYHIFVDHEYRLNQTTYVAEENLKLVSVEEGNLDLVHIHHEYLGQCFESFSMARGVIEGQQYIPNPFLSYLYPDDWGS